MEDPTAISSRQERQVKKYVQEFFEKAVAKKKEHDRKKIERQVASGQSTLDVSITSASNAKIGEDSDGDKDLIMSDVDDEEEPKQESTTPVTPLGQLLIVEGLKRKRTGDDAHETTSTEANADIPSKRLKSESPPPPPPPPPPGAEGSFERLEHTVERLDDEEAYQQDTIAHSSSRDTAELTRASPTVSRKPKAPLPPPSNPSEITDTEECGHSTSNLVDMLRDARSPDVAETSNLETINNGDECVDEHSRRYSRYRCQIDSSASTPLRPLRNGGL